MEPPVYVKYECVDKNNDLHRLDGPAIKYSDGDKSYFIHGVRYNKEDYEKEVIMLCICFKY